MTADLVVAELFGPTFQGEGPSAGQQALFVRLSNCNLACVWCDTAYTWDWARFDRAAEQRPMTVEDVRGWVLRHPTRLVVVTGGDPLLQQRRLTPLVQALAEAGRRVEVETNGTIAPQPGLTAAVAAFNVSPKLGNSGMGRDRRIRGQVLTSLVASGKAVFKFVVCDVADLDEIEALCAAFGLAPVWVMPEGDRSEAVLSRLRLLADEVVDRGWNLSARLHTLLWENARGR